MEKSPTIVEIAKAVCKFQSEIDGIKKNAKGNFGSYADLGEIWDTIRETLTSNGLSVIQSSSPTTSTVSTIDTHPKTGVITSDTKFVTNVVTVLMHISGEYWMGELSIPFGKCDPQGIGAAQTYGKRIALLAMLGLHAEDDKDGAVNDDGTAPPTKEELLNISKKANDLLAECVLDDAMRADYKNKIKEYWLAKNVSSLDATISILQSIKDAPKQQVKTETKPEPTPVIESPVVETDDLPTDPNADKQDLPKEVTEAYRKIKTLWDMVTKYKSPQSRHNSVKKPIHLGVDSLEQCTDVAKLKAYHLFLIGEYNEQKKAAAPKPTLDELKETIIAYINKAELLKPDYDKEMQLLDAHYSQDNEEGLKEMLYRLQRKSDVPFA